MAERERKKGLAWGKGENKRILKEAGTEVNGHFWLVMATVAPPTLVTMCILDILFLINFMQKIDLRCVDKI